MKIEYTYPIYEDMKISKGGFLADYDKASHACFHFYLLCEKLREKAGDSTEDQIVYEGQAWTDKPYANIARGVAIRYGLADPGEFLKPAYKKQVERQCVAGEFPTPHPEYWNVQPDTLIRV